MKAVSGSVTASPHRLVQHVGALLSRKGLCRGCGCRGQGGGDGLAEVALAPSSSLANMTELPCELN